MSWGISLYGAVIPGFDDHFIPQPLPPALVGLADMDRVMNKPRIWTNRLFLLAKTLIKKTCPAVLAGIAACLRYQRADTESELGRPPVPAPESSRLDPAWSRRVCQGSGSPSRLTPSRRVRQPRTVAADIQITPLRNGQPEASPPARAHAPASQPRNGTGSRGFG